MKINKLFLIFIFLLVFIFLFFKIISLEEDFNIEKIREPKLKESFFQGVWENLENDNKLLFKDDKVIFNNKFSENYKLSFRRIDNSKYLLSRYKIRDSRASDIKYIFTIYDNDRFLFDIFYLGADEILLMENNTLINYSKVKDSVDLSKINEIINKLKNKDSKNNNRQKQGILLGLKKTDGLYESYRTLYIKMDKMENIESFSRPHILLPRRDGFYSLKRENNNYYLKPLENKGREKKLGFENKSSIDYIGTNYIAFKIYRNNKIGLETYPIDYFDKGISVGIKEILDSDKYDYFQKYLKENNQTIFSEFSLTRNRGNWCIYNFKKEDKNFITENKFIVPMELPKNLVSFDKLNLPWGYIKSQIPYMEDSYISPEGDFLLMKVKDFIVIYEIENNLIKLEKSYKINIDKDEEIIMSEWAVGNYVDIWNLNFIE